MKSPVTDFNFERSTNINISQIEERKENTQNLQDRPVVQDVKVTSTPQGSKVFNQETSKSTSSQRKQRRKLKREKMKESQGSPAEESDRVPMLHDESSSDESDNEVVTIFPEARAGDNLQSESKLPEVTLLLLDDEGSAERGRHSQNNTELNVGRGCPHSPTSVGASNR